MGRAYAGLLRPEWDEPQYASRFARVKDYIAAGDIYQANLSFRARFAFAGEPRALYEQLRAQSGAAHCGFIDDGERQILSLSPELFFDLAEDGQITVRPMKGTAPRNGDDQAERANLAKSAKDRAENLMIVDLMRNDLSRVCAPGTVRVSELFSLERYATVHHLVSTVVGHLESGYDALHLLRAAFPGGSITGAPKLRAMEIIAELEPSQRGVYCGSIGYMSFGGELDTSIAIRTAVVRGRRVYFSAGGGIVADSDPEQEYRETLDKARALIDALAVAP